MTEKGYLHIALSDKQLKELRKIAAEYGMTGAPFAQKLILDRISEELGDPLLAKPVTREKQNVTQQQPE